jgi:anti-sigma-K factor RskA
MADAPLAASSSSSPSSSSRRRSGRSKRRRKSKTLSIWKSKNGWLSIAIFVAVVGGSLWYFSKEINKDIYAPSSQSSTSQLKKLG